MADLKAFTPKYSFPYPLAGDSVQNTYTRIADLALEVENVLNTLGIDYPVVAGKEIMQRGDNAGGDLAGSTYPNPTITTSAVTTSKINNQAVTTAKIADLNVTTGKIANAAITTEKIVNDVNLNGNPTTTTQDPSDNSNRIATTAYVDAYIAGTIPNGSIDTSELADGAVTNVKVNASAAIAYSKLNLAGSIVNADVATGAAIAYSKLALTGSITEADLSFSVATQSELDTVASNAATALSNHESDTTSIHGISDTANLVYTNDSRLTDSRTPTGGAGGVLSGTYPNPGFAVDMATQTELDNHASDTTSVHGIADTSVLATTTDISTHASDTTSIHGITDTANLVYTNDSRLSDARTPTSHAGTHVPGGSDVLDYTKIVGYGTVLPTFNATNHPAGVLWVVNVAGEPYTMYRSDGTAFKQVGGGGSITVSDSAPASPQSGALWYKSSSGKTYIYYNDGNTSQWVEVGAASQLVIPQHGSSHVRGGSDIIDADRLTIDYVPTRYTRNSAASGAGDNTDLTAHLSGIDTNLNSLWVPPMCRVSLASNQTFGTGGWSMLALATEDYDTDNMYTASNNYIEIKTAGVYTVTWSVRFGNNSTGGRIARLTLNNSLTDGNSYIGDAAPQPSSVTETTAGGVITRKFAVSDKLRINCYQNSGGNLTTTNYDINFLSAHFVGIA